VAARATINDVNVEAMTLLFALLTVVAGCGVVVLIGLSLASRSSPPAAHWLATAGASALTFAAMVATVATAGSLYLSEVAHFVPCRLCWYQRIAMYPLAPVLWLAAWRGDDGVRPYARILAGVGAVIATYHVLLERVPTLETGVCEAANPCTLRWVERFGFITIPVMSLTAFLTVLTLLALPLHEDAHQ